ncbi:MAG: YihY/virulence factor BrkB family protein [Halobacteriales archaeon]|nr:YihY/virulence factor BrkB family protein [Halobacteriales archaeon]
MNTAEFVRSVVRRAREDEVSFLSASVAFYAFFSVVPLIILALAVASFVGGEAFENRAVALVGTYLSSEGETVVAEALTSPAGRIGASAVGVVALGWSALKVFRAVDIAFDRVYETETTASFARRLTKAVVVLTAIAVAAALMVGVRSLAVRLDVSASYAAALGWLVLVVGLFAALVPVYYVMPPERVTVREILPGTATAVVGWLLLQGLFGVYASAAARYQAYGFLGAVLLFLLWLYFGATVLLLGAVVNVVSAEK